MSTDLEVAAELLKQSRDRARQSAKRGDIFYPNPKLAAMVIEANRYANAIDTILDALASITRERDAIKAEADETNGLLEEMRRQLTIAQDERDAMREGLGLAKETIHDAANRLSGFGAHHASVHFHAIAAALVNGEGGK